MPFQMRIFTVLSFLLCSGGGGLWAFGVQIEAKSELLSEYSLPGVGPCHDAVVMDDLLVVIGEGCLYTAAADEPLTPRLIGRLEGLGAVRQVVVSDHIAYVAAREDGLAIVDLQDPREPHLLAGFDTLEKATGIAVAGNLCFVACRGYGVEIIDITNPSSPAHIATAFQTLEAQSVEWDNGVLYAGIWASRMVAVADVSNPRSPVEIARIQLDGYGDGVKVRNGILYAATGHHSRLYTGTTFDMSKQDSPGWGEGHGLELWDVHQPSHPKLLSRYKTRPFFVGAPDMWSVDVCEGVALLTDTFNGVEAINVSDPVHPEKIARFALPEGKPAGGLGFGPGVLYVAGLQTALHVVPLAPVCPDPVPVIEPTVIPPANPPVEVEGWAQFCPGGQIHEAAALAGGGVALAAGNEGVHLVTLDPGPVVNATLPTKGAARSVSVCGDLLGVAEGVDPDGKGAVSIWRLDAGHSAEMIGRWQGEGTAVLQVVIPPPGRWAIIEKSARALAVLDLKDPSNPKEVASWTGPGIFYGPQIASDPVDGRYLAWWWHAGGPYWLDLDAPDHPAPLRPISGNLNSGVTGAAADGASLLVLRRNGVARLEPSDERDITDVPLMFLVANDFGRNNINGQASVIGGRLWYANAVWSQLAVAELPDGSGGIRLINALQPPGNPGRPMMAGSWIVVPDGYEGIMVSPAASFE